MGAETCFILPGAPSITVQCSDTRSRSPDRSACPLREVRGRQRRQAVPAASHRLNGASERTSWSPSAPSRMTARGPGTHGGLPARHGQAPRHPRSFSQLEPRPGAARLSSGEIRREESHMKCLGSVSASSWKCLPC